VVIVASNPALYRFLTSHIPNLTSLFHWLGRTKGSFHSRGTRTVLTQG